MNLAQALGPDVIERVRAAAHFAERRTPSAPALAREQRGALPRKRATGWALFGTPYRAEVLRALFDAAEPLTLAELGKAARVKSGAVRKALYELRRRYQEEPLLRSDRSTWPLRVSLTRRGRDLVELEICTHRPMT